MFAPLIENVCQILVRLDVLPEAVTLSVRVAARPMAFQVQERLTHNNRLPDPQRGQQVRHPKMSPLHVNLLATRQLEPVLDMTSSQ